MSWNPLTRRRELRLNALEDLRCAQRLMREDLAAFDEQLRELETQVSPSEAAAYQADHDRARAAYEAVRTAAQSAQTVRDLVALEPALHEGRFHLACALALREGTDVPSRRDPCFFNPQHGPAATDVLWAAPGEEQKRVAACRADATKISEGTQPDMRLVRVGDRWVPWYATGSAAWISPHRAAASRGYASRADKLVAEGQMRADVGTSSAWANPWGGGT
jgi:hypothetical protein